MVPALILLLLLVPILVIVAIMSNRREIFRLRDRVDELERLLARETGLPPVLTPVETPHTAPLPEPIPLHPIAHSPVETPPPTELPRLEVVPVPRPSPASSSPPRRAYDTSRAEELIGGIWLQNVGSVLLLLGVFFLILWGYTTGRVGAEFLVTAGVALGSACAWRGSHLTRMLPAFGQAFIGIGLGIVYLSLYLGHFTLHVLSTGVAFGLLTVVSMVSVAIGLQHRSQTVAVLGVIGAFVPQLIAVWIPLRGFALPPQGLLGYLAFVDLLVFVLAATAGWSALDLAALLLTTTTWTLTYRDAGWRWPIEIGLSGLFVLLGLAPLPRLVRATNRIHSRDLAVVALAPLCLIASSWPFFAHATPVLVATHLFALAAFFLAAALWVDAHRPERDLWRPLTGAAVIFLTAALERALDPSYTPMAWIVEGAVLIWLGLGPRGAWLRACGALVELSGVLWLVSGMAGHDSWRPGMPPIFHPDGIRQMVAFGALIATTVMLARRRDQLSPEERFLPELWTIAVNLLLLFWTARECDHVARAITGAPTANTAAAWQATLASRTATFACAVWSVQALIVMVLGLRERGGVLRACAYGLAALAMARLLIVIQFQDTWRPGQLPALHLTGLVQLGCVALLMTMTAWIARHEDRLLGSEFQLQRIATVFASVTMLFWLSRESTHLAQMLTPGNGPRGARLPTGSTRTLAAVFTSAAWTVQAGTLLAIGWIRNSSFLRWLGLGLLGLTVVKFLLLDLQQVDVFWRFLTAIVVGAALLSVSYLYQRRLRARTEPRA